MGRASRALPALMLHVNLLLMLFAGVILATAARLKWDPTVYIAARELFPREYKSAAVALTMIGVTVVVLAHLAIVALRLRKAARRVLLVMYATIMFLTMWFETWWGVWVAVRVQRWVQGTIATDLKQAATLGDDLKLLMHHLSHFHPLPEKISNIIEEAQRDFPWYGYVMAAAFGALLVLQMLAVALALATALGGPATPPAPRRPRSPALSTATTYTPLSIRRGDDKVPLRTTYKSGRLVVL